MAISTILLFTIIMVSMNGINSQLQIEVSKVPDIITLLENISDTSTTTSMFLPQLASLLKNQEDVQRLTNLILQNKTDMCAAEDFRYIQCEIFEDQQVNNNVTTDLLQTLNLMANTQSQIANDLNLNAGAQTRVEETLINIVKTLNESKDTQHRIEDTLDQIANTQTQTANALTQVVNLLQMQSEQLQNMTATMTYMVGQLTTQNQLISLQPNDIRDCSDLATRGAFPSGSYTIQSWDNLGSFRVYCDMDTDDGGWTVFQKRFDGAVDFYCGWNAYEDGFGSPQSEHWMGLRDLYRMTRQGDWTLRIDLEDFQDNTAFAEFRSFSVGDAASHYRLTVGAYSGIAGDSLTRHNNHAFSTKDSDHDVWSDNCAQQSQGGWWYINCGYSNLNGLYLGASQNSYTGMTWYHWKSSWEVLKRSEMKIRRTQ